MRTLLALSSSPLLSQALTPLFMLKDPNAGNSLPTPYQDEADVVLGGGDSPLQEMFNAMTESYSQQTTPRSHWGANLQPDQAGVNSLNMNEVQGMPRAPVARVPPRSTPPNTSRLSSKRPVVEPTRVQQGDVLPYAPDPTGVQSFSSYPEIGNGYYPGYRSKKKAKSTVAPQLAEAPQYANDDQALNELLGDEDNELQALDELLGEEEFPDESLEADEMMNMQETHAIVKPELQIQEPEMMMNSAIQEPQAIEVPELQDEVPQNAFRQDILPHEATEQPESFAPYNENQQPKSPYAPDDMALNELLDESFDSHIQDNYGTYPQQEYWREPLQQQAAMDDNEALLFADPVEYMDLNQALDGYTSMNEYLDASVSLRKQQAPAQPVSPAPRRRINMGVQAMQVQQGELSSWIASPLERSSSPGSKMVPDIIDAVPIEAAEETKEVPEMAEETVEEVQETTSIETYAPLVDNSLSQQVTDLINRDKLSAKTDDLLTYLAAKADLSSEPPVVEPAATLRPRILPVPSVPAKPVVDEEPLPRLHLDMNAAQQVVEESPSTQEMDSPEVQADLSSEPPVVEPAATLRPRILPVPSFPAKPVVDEEPLPRLHLDMNAAQQVVEESPSTQEMDSPEVQATNDIREFKVGAKPRLESTDAVSEQEEESRTYLSSSDLIDSGETESNEPNDESIYLSSSDLKGPSLGQSQELPLSDTAVAETVEESATFPLTSSQSSLSADGELVEEQTLLEKIGHVTGPSLRATKHHIDNMMDKMKESNLSGAIGKKVASLDPEHGVSKETIRGAAIAGTAAAGVLTGGSVVAAAGAAAAASVASVTTGGVGAAVRAVGGLTAFTVDQVASEEKRQRWKNAAESIGKVSSTAQTVATRAAKALRNERARQQHELDARLKLEWEKKRERAARALLEARIEYDKKARAAKATVLPKSADEANSLGPIGGDHVTDFYTISSPTSLDLEEAQVGAFEDYVSIAEEESPIMSTSQTSDVSTQLEEADESILPDTAALFDESVPATNFEATQKEDVGLEVEEALAAVDNIEAPPTSTSLDESVSALTDLEVVQKPIVGREDEEVLAAADNIEAPPTSTLFDESVPALIDFEAVQEQGVGREHEEVLAADDFLESTSNTVVENESEIVMTDLSSQLDKEQELVQSDSTLIGTEHHDSVDKSSVEQDRDDATSASTLDVLREESVVSSVESFEEVDKEADDEMNRKLEDNLVAVRMKQRAPRTSKEPEVVTQTKTLSAPFKSQFGHLISSPSNEDSAVGDESTSVEEKDRLVPTFSTQERAFLLNVDNHEVDESVKKQFLPPGVRSQLFGNGSVLPPGKRNTISVAGQTVTLSPTSISTLKKSFPVDEKDDKPRPLEEIDTEATENSDQATAARRSYFDHTQPQDVADLYSQIAKNYRGRLGLQRSARSSRLMALPMNSLCDALEAPAEKYSTLHKLAIVVLLGAAGLQLADE